MPLPIIIILERHWDTEPKKTLVRALPSLLELGYDTLCFESPSDKTKEETIADIEGTIKFIEERLVEANNS